MIKIRHAAERGHTQTSWLDSRHTFSFAEYNDPAHMGFRSLRVINDDRIAPGGGFATHSHRDMEIITWVVEGALEHKDSLGNGSVIHPNEIQRMSAGTGIQHSEFNHSQGEPVRLLQIWILPDRKGLAPGYEQRAIDPAELAGKLRLIASRGGEQRSVTIHQDAKIYAARLRRGQQITETLPPARSAWAQIVRGEVLLSGRPMIEGDGAAIENEGSIQVTAQSDAELLLFDLA
jgi:hypothetical protein